jgi:polyhydroxybutyrate depolymerase
MDKLWRNIVVCLLVAAIFVIPVSAVETFSIKSKENDDILVETLIPPGHDLYYMLFKWWIRSYLIHVPQGYDGSESVPLVLALHGYGHNASKLVNITSISEKSEEEGFIAVYPSGIEFIFRYALENRDDPIIKEPSWNVEFAYGPSFEYDIDDVGFIRVLIRKLQKDFNIDPGKIYVTGYSNGGMMAYRLGAELSDTIAAIAPIAGTIGGKASRDSPLWIIPEPAHHVSVITFHGTKDYFVPYYGGLAGGRLYPETLSVNESVLFWVEKNGCDPVPNTTLSESGLIITDIYVNREDGTEVILYTTVDGDHWWPGNDYFDPRHPWRYDENGEISATDIMWDFFEAHPKQ